MLPWSIRPIWKLQAKCSLKNKDTPIKVGVSFFIELVMKLGMKAVR